jgi:DNA-binding LacI/PurR family transcriptional regulator
MSDVAKLIGVSPQTVSRVVNGASYVSEAARRRVLEAVQELGYHPNSAARSLALSRSRKIGIISIESFLYGPSTLLRLIEGAADEAGYGISVVHLRDLSKRGTEEACRRFADQSADGVILIEPVHAATKFFLSLGVPLVALGRSRTRGIPGVSNDNAGDAPQNCRVPPVLGPQNGLAHCRTRRLDGGEPKGQGLAGSTGAGRSARARLLEGRLDPPVWL